MVSRFGLCQIVRKIAKIVRADDCPSGKTVRTIGGRSSRYLGRFLNGGQSCLGQRVIASALGDVLVLDEPDYDAVGKLTLRGVSRDIHVPFSFRTADEQGKPAGYLLGKTTIKRLDFGVGQGDWKSTEWVGNDVAVSYSLRLVPSAGH